jgi:hypothetical protein
MRAAAGGDTGFAASFDADFSSFMRGRLPVPPSNRDSYILIDSPAPRGQKLTR